MYLWVCEVICTFTLYLCLLPLLALSSKLPYLGRMGFMNEQNKIENNSIVQNRREAVIGIIAEWSRGEVWDS